MEGSQCLNCVRSEIHNVLSTMRRNGRWASEERFVREIPSEFENPLFRSLKSLHDFLQPFEDINDVDAVAYLQPFLDVVAYPNTNGAMTGRALSSINKFLLYGAVTSESPRGREAINLAVTSVVECKFEATNSYSDEVVLMQLLEVMVNLLRCPAGSFASDVNVWKMIETCYRLKSERGTSQILRNTAANSLTHLILTLFSRSSELVTVDTIRELRGRVCDFDGPPDGYLRTVQTQHRARRESEDGRTYTDEDFEEEEENSEVTVDEVDTTEVVAGETLLSPRTHGSDVDPDEVLYRILQPIRFGNSSVNRSMTPSAPTAESYGLPVLVKVLEFLSNLTDPLRNTEPDRIFALQLINIILESGGETLGTWSPPDEPNDPRAEASPIITVLQGDLCKHLLQNSQSLDLSVLSLTLRVIFNLFNAMKGHLKVQLEVFLTSVHLRIAESSTATPEQKELALESLLDFCREPALMLDLYTNYDCDFRCTNLFETLFKCLCRCAIPRSVLSGDRRIAMIAGLEVDEEDGHGASHNGYASVSSEDFSTNLDNIMSLSNEYDGEGVTGITVLEAVALEGVLSVIESIARRCSVNNNSNNNSSSSSTRLGRLEELKQSDVDSEMESEVSSREGGNDEDNLQWLESARERKANALRERKRLKKRLLLAARQFNKKPTKQYWLEYAQDLAILPTPVTPHDVANFFLKTPGLDKAAVGDYISEPPDKKPFNHEVMKAFIATFDFRGVRIDVALRMLLESFRLPGEAQKVDRLMEAFGTHLFEQNNSPPPDENETEGRAEKNVATGVFKSADAAFIFAFSIIMLHTDLHNKVILPEKKMKLQEFIRNNRNINEGDNLPEALLVSVYNAIKDEEMRMVYDPHAQSVPFTFSEASNDQPQSAAPGAGPTWDTILKHSQMVDKASFTPSALGRLAHLPAGIHERDMYTITFDTSMQAISVMLEMTRDGKMAARALEGFRNLGKTAVYFGMTEQFNRIMITLCRYFIRFFPALSEGGQTEQDMEGLSALRDTTVLSTQGEKASKTKLAPLLAKTEKFAAYPSCRALLTFRALLSLTKLYGNAMREAWRNFVQTLLVMHELDLLPPSFVEVDDVVDAHGNRLPTSAQDPASISKKNSSTPTPMPRRDVVRTKPAEGGGGFFSAISSFIWAEDEELDETYLACKEIIRETLAASRLSTVFSMSKSLSRESLMLLLDALLVPLEDAGFSLEAEPHGEESDEIMSPFERNTVLCVELLTEVGLANRERISEVWPILRRAYRQVLVNAGAVPEGDDDIFDNDQTNAQDPNQTDTAKPVTQAVNDRPSRLRRVGTCSVFVVERVVVSLLRISVHMLDQPSVVGSLLGALGWLGDFSDALCTRLASRIGSGLCTVLRFHSANIKTALGWRVICQLLGRYARFQDSVGDTWNILQTIVQCGYVNRLNMSVVVDTITVFIRTDERGAVPPPAPPSSPSSSHSRQLSNGSHRNVTSRWSAERAASAVKLIYEISKQVYSRDGEFCNPLPTSTEEEDVAPLTRRNSSNTTDDSEQVTSPVHTTKTGSYVIDEPAENLLPNRHKCWMMLVIQLRGWFIDMRPEVAMSATQCLQSALWSPPETIEPERWLEIFDKVLFPLVEESLLAGNEQGSIRATNLLTRTFLHNVTVLSPTSGFHLLWLRVITFLSKSLVRSATIRESTLENLKNLIMVMQSERLFESASKNAGQNLWELTWNVVEAQAPGVRAHIEGALNEMSSPSPPRQISPRNVVQRPDNPVLDESNVVLQEQTPPKEQTLPQRSDLVTPSVVTDLPAPASDKSTENYQVESSAPALDTSQEKRTQDSNELQVV
uniref:SEC7 domain-containing protein n=1 Tax=Mucochytrium quahogii TaxID=96639 RepID=A0A7S2WBL3_9STRA|mmetsp:Transcript_44930/g.71743  ORF Transcript_44930/g.71743 Transcript_44930/m.71743 type:complete len:1821 (+) Transcript_44930:49-5511(+)